MPGLKDPVRSINAEFMSRLEVISNKEMPLPGAKVRGGESDPRFSHLSTKVAEMVMFNHLATLQHKPTNSIFVVFKKTMDALHFEQADPTKYPSWLMDSDVKKTELSVYIHIMKPPYSQNPSLVLRDRSIMDVTGQTRVDKWLSEISVEWVFDTVAYYLLKNSIITQEMYGSINR